LRKDSQAIERQVLNWDPQGRRKRGGGHGGERYKKGLKKWERPVEEKGRRRDWKSGKDLWRRKVEEGIGKAGKTCGGER
jgi:hypothetical protein